MKILSEGNGAPTVIQLDSTESLIVFTEDGGHKALMASPDNPDDENELAKASAIELMIALTALNDPMIRSMIEERISNA